MSSPHGSAAAPSSLADLRQACLYVDRVLQKGDRKLFLTALKQVVLAQGGVSRVARQCRMHRETLSRMLSSRGNPEIQSLWKVLKSLGLRFCVTMDS
jgi:probable addiction module antidote protein